ncbi:MAG: transposase [Lentisphaeria bacterium]
MPRRGRHWGNNACYHITHRCHERRYLFRFVKYRDMYRKYLFEAARRFNISVLSYVVTSNHVHLLVATGRRGRPQVSEALQHVHGEMGQHYNIAKKREGSFWSNRFHATWVETGVHLRRCLSYIDMNMVRAGAVARPEQWRHSSAHELATDRQRYRIVDRGALVRRLGFATWQEFREWYASELNRVLEGELFRSRQAFWSDSLAVGSDEWVVSRAEACGMKRYSIAGTEMDWPGGVKTSFLTKKNSS